MYIYIYIGSKTFLIVPKCLVQHIKKILRKPR